MVLRRRRLRRLRISGGTSAEGASLDDMDALVGQLEAIARRVDAVETQVPRTIQRVGVVRFNPFPDTGGNQSFVVALLDTRGDGVVLSSLHSRQGTRVYLKQVISGKSETTLSEEETEAIRRAGAG